MHSTQPKAIATYQPREYIQHLTPEPEAFPELLSADAQQFFVGPVEQLYPRFTQPMPPARTTVHFLLYLTSGAARLNIGNEAYTVGPGGMLLVRAGQVYAFQQGEVNTGFVCLFHDDLLLGTADSPAAFEFLHFGGQPLMQLPEPTAGFVEQLLRRLHAEYATHQLQYPVILRAYLLALLHELNRAYAAEAPVRATAAVTITTGFKQLVATSLRTTHRVSDYAARLCVSTNHLSKCVRRVTGKSPAKWIEESIVLEAKVLLFQSTWSVGEIAEAVGMADASYFSRLFRKHTGLTPLEFRKRSGSS